MILSFSCMKDKNKPFIILNGDVNFELAYGSATPDPGATANDEEDGNISNKIKSDWSSKVNVNKLGDYVVTYTVSDQKGNEAIATRKVRVRYFSSNFIGDYHTSLEISGGAAPSSFISKIEAGENNKQFYITPFLHSSIKLQVEISGLYGDQFSYSQPYSGGSLEGSGTIENDGATLIFTFRIYSQPLNLAHGKETLTRL